MSNLSFDFVINRFNKYGILGLKVSNRCIVLVNKVNFFVDFFFSFIFFYGRRNW